MAALLVEKGLTLGDSKTSNHLAIKAIILNSARKRHMNVIKDAKELQFAKSEDWGGSQDLTVSDKEYLSVVGGIPKYKSTTSKTRDWTPADSGLSADGKTLTVFSPLDDAQGTGILDAERALFQWAQGKKPPGDVKAVGWAVEKLKTGTHEYAIQGNITKGAMITVTLTNDRIVNRLEKEGGGIKKDHEGNSFAPVDGDDSYQELTKTDKNLGARPLFTLEILKGTTVVAISQGNDTVQHLHVPGEGVGYKLRVSFSGSSPKNEVEYPYALAWWTTVKP